jgi:hypothetical protein
VLSAGTAAEGPTGEIHSSNRSRDHLVPAMCVRPL